MDNLVSTAKPQSVTPVQNGSSAASHKRALGQWVGPVTIMMFILGAFIGLALKTENIVRTEDLPSSRYSGLAEAYIGMKRSMFNYQATIKSLQNTNDALNDQITQRQPQMKIMDDQVKQARFIAGLTNVEGPGVIVTLNDSKHRAPTSGLPGALLPQIAANYLIHDVDIQRVLNELKAGGAESFAVNNERVIGTTAVRCVGPAIQVNGIPIAPPYKIRAIGDPAALMTEMNMQGGIADQFKMTDPAMFVITKDDHMVLKAYDGATHFRFAKPVASTISTNPNSPG